MRRMLLGTLLAVAAPTAADQAVWVSLDGAAIRALLTGSTIQYESAVQDFRASGRTLYNAGRDSWGYWAVRGDQYCSTWPPSDLWACYDMAQNGDLVRFIGEAGDVTDGTLQLGSE